MKHLKKLLGKGFKPLAAALAVAALGLAAAPASAATVVVNTTSDQSLGSCSVTCSLRDAVATANSGDTVQIPAGHYILTLGDIISEKSLTIVGAGARSTVLDGNDASRIFQFFNGTQQSVELTDLSLINGLAATPDGFGALAGGALTSDAILTLRRCRLAGNQAEAGGAISLALGDLTIDQCTIAGNLATSGGFPGGGGGIFAFGSLVTITNSTLTGNTASAGQGGGAAFVDVLVDLFNVTVTANQAPSGGGLFLAVNGSLVNSIVADNLGGDCFGVDSTFTSDHSLDSDDSCGLTDAGSHPGVSPLLGPLANNGGPTDTHALLAGSPALNAGNNATCLATDQRGVTRPQGSACDIGAFEAIVVLTPQEQIAALIAQVEALDLASRIENNLVHNLDKALRELQPNPNTGKAIKELGKFIKDVQKERGTGISVAAADALIAAAQQIIAQLGG
jgi:CSLREA domain-containing protein